MRGPATSPSSSSRSAASRRCRSTPATTSSSVVMKAKAHKRGEFRQLAAQMVMLYMTHRESGGEKLCDINRDAIDTFYYKHLDFDLQSDERQAIPRNPEPPDASAVGRQAQKGYRPRGDPSGAADGQPDGRLHPVVGGQVRGGLRQVQGGLGTRQELPTQRQPHGVLAQVRPTDRANTDRADTILRRHQFFAEKMHELLKPQLKDPTRIFGALERELIYYRDKKKCQLPGCGGDVTWADHEIHHVEQHSKGGPTTMGNGALMHKHCPPERQQGDG